MCRICPLKRRWSPATALIQPTQTFYLLETSVVDWGRCRCEINPAGNLSREIGFQLPSPCAKNSFFATRKYLQNKWWQQQSPHEIRSTLIGRINSTQIRPMMMLLCVLYFCVGGSVCGITRKGILSLNQVCDCDCRRLIVFTLGYHTLWCLLLRRGGDGGCVVLLR